MDSLDAAREGQGSLQIGREIISGILMEVYLPVVLLYWVPSESEQIIIGRAKVPKTEAVGVLDSCDDERFRLIKKTDQIRHSSESMGCLSTRKCISGSVMRLPHFRGAWN